MKKTDFFKYFLFTFIFIYTFSWLPINLFLSSLGQKKSLVTIIEDKQIQQLIQDKAGMDVKTIRISESDHPFGMMIGIPMQPQLVLSRGLYETFTPEEMEYVVLHEAGHYKLWHGVIEFIAGIILFTMGILVLRKINLPKLSIPTALVLGLVFGILMVRIGHFHELQADNYTVKKMTNPEGMIQATNKFQNYHRKRYTQSDNKLIQFLFYRGNPYENRIKMAQEEIKERR